MWLTSIPANKIKTLELLKPFYSSWTSQNCEKRNAHHVKKSQEPMSVKPHILNLHLFFTTSALHVHPLRSMHFLVGCLGCFLQIFLNTSAVVPNISDTLQTTPNKLSCKVITEKLPADPTAEYFLFLLGFFFHSV